MSIEQNVRGYRKFEESVINEIKPHVREFVKHLNKKYHTSFGYKLDRRNSFDVWLTFYKKSGFFGLIKTKFGFPLLIKAYSGATDPAIVECTKVDYSEYRQEKESDDVDVMEFLVKLGKILSKKFNGGRSNKRYDSYLR